MSLLPPLWLSAIAVALLLGAGTGLYRWLARDGLRARSAAAAVAFTVALAAFGWGSWALSELPPREVVFALLWSLSGLYFYVAARAFKLSLRRFKPTTTGDTSLHLLEAVLWGPIMVAALVTRRR